MWTDDVSHVVFAPSLHYPLLQVLQTRFSSLPGRAGKCANHIHHSEQVLFRRLFPSSWVSHGDLFPVTKWNLTLAICKQTFLFSPGVNKADFGPFTVPFPGLRCVCVITPRDKCSEILIRICSSKRVNKKWEKKNHIRQKHSENENSRSQRPQNKVMVWN